MGPKSAFLGGGVLTLAACSLVVDTSGLAGNAATVDGGARDAAVSPSPEASIDGGTDARTSSPYRDAVLADSPLAYWRMNIASGATVVPDETGHGHDLQLQGTGHVLGVAGAIARDADTAIELDGVGSFLRASNAAPFAFTGLTSFTVECWARVKDPPGRERYQHLLGHSVGQGSQRSGYLLYVVPVAPSGDTPHASFEWAIPDLPGGIGARLAAREVWAHYVGTFDGLRASIYVDGELAQSSKPLEPLRSRATDFLVGADVLENSFFGGAVDEVAVYPRALPGADVLRHHTVARGE